MTPKRMTSDCEEVLTAEPYIVDFDLLRNGSQGDREALLEVVERASFTGLLHIVNHGLSPDLFEKLNELTIAYMETTPVEQKDRDSAVKGTGSFEGYKARTEYQKTRGITDPVEEYNYDFKGPGSVVRPKVFQDHDSVIQSVLNFEHYELTPRLLDLINEFCGLETGELRKLHSDSSEVAHFLYYHVRWYHDEDRKLAAYAGHTDIGSVTYLTSNPIAGLQVYGPEGWRHVTHIPNAILVNMGDAMEFMTRGRMNATLHRVIKPCVEQDAKCRPAFIYFIHPNHDIMSKCLAHRRELIAKLSAESRESPGGLVGSIGLNRVISAVSLHRDDTYLSAVDRDAWNRVKRGEKVNSPPGVVIDYQRLIMKRA